MNIQNSASNLKKTEVVHRPAQTARMALINFYFFFLNDLHPHFWLLAKKRVLIKKIVELQLSKMFLKKTGIGSIGHCGQYFESKKINLSIYYLVPKVRTTL